MIRRRSAGLRWAVTAGAAAAALAIFSVSSAAAWLTTTDLSATGQDAELPVVATGADGTTAVVWTRSDGTNDLIQVAIRAPGESTFGAPKTLTQTGLNADSPDIDVADDGTVTVVWARDNGSDDIVQVSTREAGSSSFSAPVDLSAAGENSGFAQVESSADGTTTVSWIRNGPSSTLVQAATRQAGRDDFSSPVTLASTGSPFFPSLAVGDDGTTVIAWNENLFFGGAIRASIREAGSNNFSVPIELTPAGALAAAPQAAIGPDGQVTVVFLRDPGPELIVQEVTSATGSGTFSAPVDLTATGQNAQTPDVAIAPDGSTTVVFARSEGGNVLAQARTRSASESVFGAPVLLSADGQDASNTRVAIGEDGSSTVVWLRSNGTNLVVQAATRAAGGSTFSSPADLSAAGQSAGPPSVSGGPCDSYSTVVWARSNGTNQVVQQASEATAVCEPNLASLKVKGPAKVKRKKKTIYKVTITNNGDGAATGLRLKAQGRGVSASKTAGQIAAGTGKTVKIALRFKKKGKAKVAFTLTSANATKKVARKTVRVR